MFLLIVSILSQSFTPASKAGDLIISNGFEGSYCFNQGDEESLIGRATQVARKNAQNSEQVRLQCSQPYPAISLYRVISKNIRSISGPSSSCESKFAKVTVAFRCYEDQGPYYVTTDGDSQKSVEDAKINAIKKAHSLCGQDVKNDSDWETSITQVHAGFEIWFHAKARFQCIPW